MGSSFEERECLLNGKLLKCRTDKAQVVVDLTECQERLAGKLEEIHSWQQKDARIQREFDQIVGGGGEKNEFYEALKKIFVRKMKRQNQDQESDDDDDDDSDEEESESDDECPKDCDNLMYEKVMELREKRLDEEEILNEFEAAVNELRQQNQNLIVAEKKIDKNLNETEREISIFQTEKQHFLNQIVVTVPLRLSQIRMPLCNTRKKQENKMLIFEMRELDNLQRRIAAQNEQKNETKKDYVELKKLNKSLTKKMNGKELKIDAEKRKCEQVQFLKYGRLVPLEVLDAGTNMHSNQEQVVLAEQLEQIKKTYKQKLNAMDAKVKQSKENLKNAIMCNTAKVEKMTNLKRLRAALCTELSSILDIDVIADSAPSDEKRNRELQKLVQVAKTQANEIDVLKAEIHLLQRKGGMLYAVPEA